MSKKSNKKQVKKEEAATSGKFDDLIDQIEKMSVLELSTLVEDLEAKFGPVQVAAAGAGTSGADSAEGEAQEQGSAKVNIELTEAGDNKLGIIKAVKKITQKGLKDCKDIVEDTPQVIVEDVDKEEAQEMKKELEETGAKVTLK